MDEFLKIAAAGGGLSAAIALWSVYQSSKREERMAGTLDQMQKFQTETLTEMNSAQSAALAQNTVTMQQTGAALQQNTAMLATVLKTIEAKTR